MMLTDSGVIIEFHIEPFSADAEWIQRNIMLYNGIILIEVLPNRFNQCFWLSLTKPTFQFDRKWSPQHYKRILVIRFLLVCDGKPRIKLPEEHPNNISYFHHCKTDVNTDSKKNYGFPMQLREP